ncbi:MAG TPA: flagellar motor protein [Polyangiaceae bacterium]|jgi:chemotaxis protein MotA|nr:flagellar motor protein [Polyangiaceae bacterium]
MDFGALIGIAIALGCIIGGNAMEGGHFASMLGLSAAIIVIGGTIGAIVVQFPFATVGGAVGAVGRLFKKPAVDGAKLVDEIVDYANRARRDGILALESVAAKASHPFLSKALMMAIDGSDSTSLRSTMEITIGQKEEHGEDAAKVLEAGGGYAPTVGIIGAVLGLIHVMSNLSDIAAVGEGIAAAFVATIYGVAIANLIFLPMAGRIKMQVRDEVQIMEMMLTGVLAIQEGTNPKLVRERLSEFVHNAHGDKKKGAGQLNEASAT